MANEINLLNSQNNFDQKIKLFQEEITNNLEQQYRENLQSFVLKIQKMDEENKDKITHLEQIIQQKDEKIDSVCQNYYTIKNFRILSNIGYIKLTL